MRVIVLVWLKPGILDPVAIDLKKKFANAGCPVHEIKTGKRFEMEVDTNDREEANRIAIEVCEKLLANATIERFELVNS